MAFWGHTLGRKNVFLTCLYTWYVYDGSAAWRVIYTAMPQVGCSFVKMRNKWLPRASEEKPLFLKKYYQDCLSLRDLVGRRALFCTNWMLLLWDTQKPFSSVRLSCDILEELPPLHLLGQSLLSFPEAQLSFLTHNLMVGRSVVFL